jgi:hypothetical protein
MNLTHLFLLLFAKIKADEQHFQISKNVNFGNSYERIFGNPKNLAILGKFGPVGSLDPTKSTAMGKKNFSTF